MRTDAFEPVWVETMPPKLERGKLYISTRYRTTSHLCASGCGVRVVLPLSPAEWRLYFDGVAVSLNPSVGNWEFPCRAHYWIRRNQVLWALDFSDEDVEAARRRDEQALDRYFSGEIVIEPSIATGRPPSLWRSLLQRIRGGGRG